MLNKTRKLTLGNAMPYDASSTEIVSDLVTSRSEEVRSLTKLLQTTDLINRDRAVLIPDSKELVVAR